MASTRIGSNPNYMHEGFKSAQVIVVVMPVPGDLDYDRDPLNGDKWYDTVNRIWPSTVSKIDLSANDVIQSLRKFPGSSSIPLNYVLTCNQLKRRMKSLESIVTNIAEFKNVRIIIQVQSLNQIRFQIPPWLRMNIDVILSSTQWNELSTLEKSFIRNRTFCPLYVQVKNDMDTVIIVQIEDTDEKDIYGSIRIPIVPSYSSSNLSNQYPSTSNGNPYSNPYTFYTSYYPYNPYNPYMNPSYNAYGSNCPYSTPPVCQKPTSDDESESDSYSETSDDSSSSSSESDVTKSENQSREHRRRELVYALSRIQYWVNRANDFLYDDVCKLKTTKSS